jgi:hypothetical protein
MTQGALKAAGSEEQAREARVVCLLVGCHMVCYMVRARPESKADKQTPSSRPSTGVEGLERGGGFHKGVEGRRHGTQWQ